jgi:hypothetical protein
VTDRTERIDHLADLIRSFQFKYGETYKALAREWGVTYQYVRDLGTDAFAVVRGELVEPEVATVSACVALQRVVEEAGKDGDRRMVIDAANAWTKLAYQHKDHTTRGKGGDAGSLKNQIAVVRSVLDALESQEPRE